MVRRETLNTFNRITRTIQKINASTCSIVDHLNSMGLNVGSVETLQQSLNGLSQPVQHPSQQVLGWHCFLPQRSTSKMQQKERVQVHSHGPQHFTSLFCLHVENRELSLKNPITIDWMFLKILPDSSNSMLHWYGHEAMMIICGNWIRTALAAVSLYPWKIRLLVLPADNS